MISSTRLLAPFVCLTLLTAADSLGQGTPSLTTLHSFSALDFNQHNIEGIKPRGKLLQSGDGAIYGTTTNGGAAGFGTIFQISADERTLTVLHAFADGNGEGNEPNAGLIQSRDGDFYGTTVQGGSFDDGTVFRLSSDGQTFTTIHRLTDQKGEGYAPYAPVIQSSDGTFYGTTFFGGAKDEGTIFRFSPDGEFFTTVHQFSDSQDEGSGPYGALLQASDGNFYGVTVGGAASTTSQGTIFRFSANGQTFTTLHRFTGSNGEGADPLGELIQGSDGNFYGTTNRGGVSGNGTIFRLSSNGQTLTTLHSFTGTGGEGAGSSAGLLQAKDGNFYGTTSGGGASGNGTVFRLSSDGKTLTMLHNFTGANGDGAVPEATLIQASNGKLYGTTYYGGTNNEGVIFAVTLAKPPVITSATSATTTVGKAFSYQLTASNSPTSYATSSVPPGLSFSTSTGKFTGTPTKVGTYKPLLSATNSAGTGRINLNLTVNPAAPVITSDLTGSAQVGVAYSYQVTATNNPTKYAISSLPPGLTFSTSTGKLSGTPTKAGTYRPLVSATNAGGTGSANVNLSIKPAKPVITSELNPPARQGVAFSYQITATNSPTSFATSSVPPGLSFDASKGRFTGTPSKAGTYKPLISATNGGGTGSVNLNLVVKAPE